MDSPAKELVNLSKREVASPLRCVHTTNLPEIFKLTVLPEVRFPELINANRALLADSFVVPDSALPDVPPALRFPVPREQSKTEPLPR